MGSTYSVHVTDGIIVVTTRSPQTPGSMVALSTDVEKLLVEKHGPKDILVLQEGDAKVLDERVLEIANQALRELPFRRLAVIGTRPRRLAVVRRLLMRDDTHDRFKLFRKEEDARDWLDS